jgi:hypothetical protein
MRNKKARKRKAMKKTVRVTLLLIITTVCQMSLVICTRLLYYLEQVHKVYGKVTMAGSTGETPIGSVEVCVGDYQYSELTNYYGDFELEMVEGIWTINFHKPGYESFSTKVTLSAEEPQVQLDVELVWIEPPAPIDLTGFWDLTLDPDTAPGEGPYVYYMAQTGTKLYTTPGEPTFPFSGKIDGSAVTLTYIFSIYKQLDPSSGQSTNS